MPTMTEGERLKYKDHLIVLQKPFSDELTVEKLQPILKDTISKLRKLFRQIVENNGSVNDASKKQVFDNIFSEDDDLDPFNLESHASAARSR